MVQSAVRQLCVHPTWFMGNSYFIVNVFHKIKAGIRTSGATHRLSFPHTFPETQLTKSVSLCVYWATDPGFFTVVSNWLIDFFPICALLSEHLIEC